MQVLLGLVRYVDPPNACAPIPGISPVACEKGLKEIPTDPGIKMDLLGASHPYGL